MKKAKHASEASRLEQIPSVGVSIANDLRAIGISKPTQLKGQDGIALYKLENVKGQRHDPCVASYNDGCGRFYELRKPKPWGKHTKTRKTLIN